MADLATVFSWSLRDMQEMTLAELARWREEARKRHEGGQS